MIAWAMGRARHLRLREAVRYDSNGAWIEVGVDETRKTGVMHRESSVSEFFKSDNDTHEGDNLDCDALFD